MPTSKHHILFNTFLLAIVLLFSSNLSTANGNEALAKKLFSDEKFSEALPFYEQLYTLYPNDGDIQYNYAVCLCETADYSQKTKKLLLQASLNDAPTKVYFYIGKIYHASNNFETAASYYLRFEEKAKKKELKSVGFSALKEACNQKVNPFEKTIREVQEKDIDTNIIPTELIQASLPDSIQKKTDVTADKTPIIRKDTITAVETPANDSIFEVIHEPLFIDSSTKPVLTPPELKEVKAPHIEEDFTKKTTDSLNTQLIVPKELKDTLFSFFLTAAIQYIQIDQFKTGTGKQEFIRGWTANRTLQNKLEETKNLRKRYLSLNDEAAKKNIATQILDMEMEAPELKLTSDQAFSKAREAELLYWKNVSADEILKLAHTNDSIQAQQIQLELKIEATVKENPDVAFQSDSTQIEKADSVSTEPEAPIDQLIYKVQIGAYSKGLPGYVDRLYKKLSVLRKIENYTDDRGVVVYTVGEVSSFSNALELQKQIRQEGVKDAFVVAYNHGKRITLNEAREIEKK